MGCIRTDSGLGAGGGVDTALSGSSLQASARTPIPNPFPIKGKGGLPRTAALPVFPLRHGAYPHRATSPDGGGIFAWLLVAVCLFASQAQAKPEPVRTPGADASPGAHVSYSQWSIDGRTVRLRFMVSATEAQAMAGPGKPALRTSEVADAVSQALTVTSDAGDCLAIDQGEGVGEIYTMAVTPGLDRFEIVYVCDDPKGMSLHDKFLFDKVRSHVDYARVQVGSDAPALSQFTRDRQALTVPVKGPGLAVYARQGAMRLLRRPEALGLLAGLLLLSLRWRDLGWIAGGLAGGYVLSLIAAWAGLVMSRPPLSGTATGLLVVVVAIAGLRRQSSLNEQASKAWRIAGVLLVLAMAIVAGVAAFRVGDMSAMVTGGLAFFGLALIWDARSSERPGWLILGPALVFGLLDGMGPASDLSVLTLPWTAAQPALIGDDLGAGGLAIAMVAAAMALLWLVGHKLHSVRKPVTDIAGAALIGLGVFWFVTQLFS
jgi:hypothetical protein